MRELKSIIEDIIIWSNNAIRNLGGRINEALTLLEPVFNFGQTLENREIINVIGNFSSESYCKSNINFFFLF